VKRLMLFVLVIAAGCQQGKGDRCQIMSDCTTPLVCNAATQTCEETSGGGLDATVPDGPKDAPVDAPPDVLIQDAPHD